MKNLIVVGNTCTRPEMTYEAIKKVSIDNDISTISIGLHKSGLNSVEWQACFYANHNDLTVFDASVNVPKRKLFSFPISQLKRILNYSASYGSNNIMLILHTGDLASYRSVMKKAVSSNINIITMIVD